MNSILYAQALAEHKVPFTLRIYPKGLHGLATADDQTCASWASVPNVHEWMDASAQWLLETM
jgi:acetyl esterase/lipase